MAVRDLVVTLIGRDETGPAFDGASDRASKLGTAFKVGGAAAGVALVGGLVGALNIEEANNKLKAQLGLTAEESKRFGKLAGDLYKNNYGESVSGVNDAIGAVVSSIDGMRGASNEAVGDMAAKALNLATAFDVDVGRAAQVAGQMINSGLAKDGVHAMDLLTASMQKVPAAVREDLLDAADEYGPFMSSLGLTGEKAFGLLSASAEKGAFGIDKTGDALKEFTIRATDMSTASKVGYDALGLSQEEMTKKLLAGGPTAEKAFGQIVGGLQKIKDPAKQSQAALALFGTPLEDLSVSEIPQFLKGLTSTQNALGDTAGAADEMDTSLNAGASASLSLFKRQAEMAVVTLANNLLPAFRTVATFLATTVGPVFTTLGNTVQTVLLPAMQAAFGFIQSNQTTFTVMAGVIAAVLIPAMVAMGVTATTAGAQVVAAWVAQQVASVKATAMVLLGYTAIAAGWVMVAVQATASAARMAAAWLVAIGPIAIVVAAVVGVVALVIKYWDEIVAATKAAWDAVVGAIKAAWDGIKAGVSAAVGAVKAVVTTVFDAIKGYITTVVGAWKAVVTTTWDAIKAAVSTVVNGIKTVISTVFDAVKAYISTVVGAYKAIITTAWDGIKAVVSGAVDGVKAAVTGAFNAVKTFISGVMDGIKGIIGRAWDTIVSGVTGLGGRISGAAKGVFDGIKNAFKDAINFIIRGWNSLSFDIPSIDLDWNGPLPGGKVKVGGFGIGVPQIPQLAEGGIVPARPGGTLANIGERGQSEAVIPLPDGLRALGMRGEQEDLLREQNDLLRQLLATTQRQPREMAMASRSLAGSRSD